MIRVDKLPAGIVNDDRLVEHRHHRVEPPFHALEVREQAGAVEGEPDAPRQHLGEVDVGGGVTPLGPGGDQRQGAERSASGGHRSDDRRPRPQRFQKREVLGISRHAPQILGVHARPEVRDMSPGRLGGHETPRNRRRAAPKSLLDRGSMGHPTHADRRAHHPAFVDRVDHAHVGGFGDDQLGRSAQGLGQRQRAISELADRVEQPQTVGGAAPPVARVGAGHRERTRGDDRSQADQVGGTAIGLPKRARRAGQDCQAGYQRRPPRAREQGADEGSHEIGPGNER